MSHIVPLSQIVSSLESGSRPKGGIVEVSDEIRIFSMGGEHLDDVGGFNFSNERFVPKSFYEQMTQGIVKPLDIVIVKDGATTGKVSFVGKNFPYFPCVINEHIFRLEIKQNVADSLYVFYYLLSSKGNHEIMFDFHGATVGGISRNFTRNVHIPLPPLPEQHRIVSLLADADHERHHRRFTQSLSDTFLQSVFVEMFGDPSTNPMGWPIVKMGSLVTFITSGSRGWARYYSENGARFIRVQNLRGHRLNYDDLAYVTPPDTAETKRTRVQPGDLLLAITGATIGLSALVPQDIGQAYVNQHVAIIRLKESVNRCFVAAFMAHEQGGQRQIWAMQYGDTRPGLGFEQIRSLTIPVPPLELQYEYEKIVSDFTKINLQQRESARQADHLFQALLHRAFRGEL